MSDLNDTLTLTKLADGQTYWGGTSHDILRRTGPMLSLTMDVPTWEQMGRPVDLGMTLVATTEPEEELEAPGRVVTEIYEERIDQIERGYTPEHDDEHGLQHIMDQEQQRTAGKLWSRESLVEAAAVLVAAIEWFDRNPSRGPLRAIRDEPQA